ncbi:ATP-binding protein [Uliginosibacterium sp. 31-12]|uniref:ATP-binding protein n=1 Tax=Uliginosibacterium sp. 31-12 TaxID=3062781 RepID=UPI0026E1656B|nr:ATP-binding protein [Uliginosibacterium sp. 31-12]MDO6385399.1 ATP-binding protein [Uliginosibacterium sp. 31-12]
MQKKVQLTTEGIKKHLSNTTPEQALAEYVWNGLDAKASSIEVCFELNPAGGIAAMHVSDNGHGIPFELLEQKFGVFMDSEKIIHRSQTKRTSSETHGKDGIGRLTFCVFAQDAEWVTVYEQEGRKYRYTIKVSATDLVSYPSENPREVDAVTPTGTVAHFYNMSSHKLHPEDAELRKFLVSEFCWRLLLDKELKIKLNGNLIAADENIDDQALFCPLGISGPVPTVHFVRWKHKLHREYSRYYFLDSTRKEKWTNFTSLNKKGDQFHHSVYVQSPFFDTFSLGTGPNEQAELALDENSQKSDWFKSMLNATDSFLRSARKDFLRDFTDKLITQFEQKDIFPTHNERNQWEVLKHTHLAETIGKLHNFQPNLFSSGSIEQKKIFVRLIDQLLDSSEAETLYQIIGQVLDLDQEEKTELLDVLKSSRLRAVIKTAKLIQDRYRALEQIKRLNWDKSLVAKEVPHIQEFMERHFWIIGEEYSLVVAAEKDFEQALRALYDKVGLRSSDNEIDHADKNKEMDILLVRQDQYHDKIHNVVLELKHPNKKLGKKFVDQVMTYFEVILSDPRFNASNMEWSYYLIGNNFSSSGYIEGMLENAKPHGITSLIYKAKNHKIFAKRWSELITDVELRHKFLNDRLQVQREQLAMEECTVKTADQVIQRAQKLSCAN